LEKPGSTFADRDLVVGALCLGEGSIARHEARNHRWYELCRFDSRLDVFLGKQLGIKGKIAVDGGGSSIAIFTGLWSGTVESFSLVMARVSSLILREHEIAIDDHSDREARPDREGRLDIDLAPDELLAGLIERVLAATPQGPDGTARSIQAPRRYRARLRAPPSSKDCPNDNRRHPEPGIAFRVGAGLAFKHNRLAVRKYDPVPDEQDTRLAKRHLAVIGPD
jgi:hypothetical protein